MGRGAWQAIVCGVAESGTTERLRHTLFHMAFLHQKSRQTAEIIQRGQWHHQNYHELENRCFTYIISDHLKTSTV